MASRIVKKYFTANDHTWSGSFYELALEIGERSDQRLERALRRIWSYPLLEGCYLDRELEPEAQPRVEPSLAVSEEVGHLLGLARLPDGRRAPCSTFLLREDDGPDWLDFYVPMGVLYDLYGDADEGWQDKFDRWLADLGIYVYGAMPYRLGLIGHEVLADAYAEAIAQQGIPEDRYFGYLWPEPGGGSIDYYPRNRQWGEGQASTTGRLASPDPGNSLLKRLIGRLKR